MRQRLQGMAHRVTGSLRSSMEFRRVAAAALFHVVLCDKHAATAGVLLPLLWTRRCPSRRVPLFLHAVMCVLTRSFFRRWTWTACWKRTTSLPTPHPSPLFRSSACSYTRHSYSERLLQMMQRKLNQSSH